MFECILCVLSYVLLFGVINNDDDKVKVKVKVTFWCVSVCLWAADSVGQCYVQSQCPHDDGSRPQITSMSECCCPQQGQGQGWRDGTECIQCPPPSSGDSLYYTSSLAANVNYKRLIRSIINIQTSVSMCHRTRWLESHYSQ